MALTKSINLGKSKNWSVPRNTFAKQLGSAGNNAGLSIQTTVYDEVTPALDYLNTNWHPAIANGLMQAGMALKQSVRSAYFKFRAAYPNAPLTVELKGGKPTLEETGALREAMSDLSGIELSANLQKAQVKVWWDLPESGGTGKFPDFRKNNNFEYIWAQEFGSPRMSKRVRYIFKQEYFETGTGGVYKARGNEKKLGIVTGLWVLEARPFFVRGMQDGAQKALGMLIANIAPVLEEFKRWKTPRYKPLGISMAPESPLPKAAWGSLVWYALPPSSMYKYIGIVSDLHGVWDSTFSERAVWAYVRQYAYGQGGATRKSVRRKFRRKVWY